jgi:hypothetical protein
MEFLKKIEPLIWVYLIVLIIIAQFKGMAYDIAKEKEDRKYKGNHGISFKYGKLRFALPLLILSKSKNQNTVKYAKSYNGYVINIYITLTVLLGIYLFLG